MNDTFGGDTTGWAHWIFLANQNATLRLCFNTISRPTQQSALQVTLNHTVRHFSSTLDKVTSYMQHNNNHIEPSFIKWHHHVGCIDALSSWCALKSLKRQHLFMKCFRERIESYTKTSLAINKRIQDSAFSDNGTVTFINWINAKHLTKINGWIKQNSRLVIGLFKHSTYSINMPTHSRCEKDVGALNENWINSLNSDQWYSFMQPNLESSKEWHRPYSQSVNSILQATAYTLRRHKQHISNRIECEASNHVPVTTVEFNRSKIDRK